MSIVLAMNKIMFLPEDAWCAGHTLLPGCFVCQAFNGRSLSSLKDIIYILFLSEKDNRGTSKSKLSYKKLQKKFFNHYSCIRMSRALWLARKMISKKVFQSLHLYQNAPNTIAGSKRDLENYIKYKGASYQVWPESPLSRCDIWRK